MTEPESLRSIARRLIIQHRQRKLAQLRSQALADQRFDESIFSNVPLALVFDVSLTEADCKFLRSMRIGLH